MSNQSGDMSTPSASTHAEEAGDKATQDIGHETKMTGRIWDRTGATGVTSAGEGNTAAELPPAEEVVSDSSRNPLPARLIGVGTIATVPTSVTAGALASTLMIRIHYDPWIFDHIHRLANPRRIRSNDDYVPNQYYYMDIGARSISYEAFKKKAYKRFGSVSAEHDVVGILKVEERLGHLVWMGRITDRDSYWAVDFYEFPAKYPAFRRRLLNTTRRLRGEVRIKHSEAFLEESMRRPVGHQTDDEVTDEDVALAEVRLKQRWIGPRPAADFPCACFQGLEVTDPHSEADVRTQIVPQDAAVSSHGPGDIDAERAAKRARWYPASVEVSMEEFFYVCHLRTDDVHTMEVMENNDFYHWSAFKGMSAIELVNTGFRAGVARLIVNGVRSIAMQVDAQASPSA
ncbi:hypothetical protein PGT21_020861 [Puccinia graminis f. sp. tritici]|uniref:Uncharacterized protein n=1 Tax=Puccinia graminis f. sp. tritici TaxID=56615 RepID=A0A5B0QBY9_PUCGR|nr:hypothetical protein PGT21_020861 [Puccinia graminis f. sp. tritici]